MLRHIIAVICKFSIILRLDIGLASPLTHMGQTVIRQPDKRAVAEKHNFLNTQFHRLL